MNNSHIAQPRVAAAAARGGGKGKLKREFDKVFELTPTLLGKDRIRLFFLSKATRRQASWLNSTILCSPPARRMNSTICVPRHNKERVSQRRSRFLFCLRTYPLEQLARRTTSWREDDDLDSKTESETRTKNCNGKCLPATNNQQSIVTMEYDVLLVVSGADPKRRGVLMRTSELHFVQPSALMIAGLSVLHTSL